MSLPRSVKVFLSYSHKDEELKKELDSHLSALKRLEMIETWNDRQIPTGDEWKKHIDQRLNDADIILLLISSDFLASDYCYQTETLAALDRYRRGSALVIPIVLREVQFRGLPIADLQMLPTDGHPVLSSFWHSRDEAFKNIADGIRTRVEEFLEKRSLEAE